MPDREVIGLIPCAGPSSRIAPLPCSKEILPVGYAESPDGSLRPKAVSHYLLEKFHRAGVRKTFFILRKGKWDIPEYYGDGDFVDMGLGYLLARLPYGAPYSLDQAYPFVRTAQVVLGFPDILLEPADAFARALQRLNSTHADLVLGLYRAHDPRCSDMIAIDRGGRIREFVIKPPATRLKLVWMFAVWTPAFTEFMHRYLAVPRTAAQRPGAGLPAQLSVGHVLEAAIREGLHAQSIVFPKHDYMDTDTPEGMRLTAAGSRLGKAA